MKLSRPNKIKWNYPLLAFLFPFLGMLAVMLISQYRPFGKYSMLYSDMYHQYYPFFIAFRRTLRSGGSLLYNWSIGMGVDYLGLIAYYLASPLNLLSVLIPERFVLDYFSLLVPLKLGFAAVFFALFLKKTSGRDDFSISVFGGFYGLCAWALGYQWNVMWLDTFALLPLAAIGTVSLIREKKFFLYTVTLFLSVFSNYYIGFFTCIFVALIFFCVEACDFPGWKRFAQDLGRIALFSVLAIGMTAVLSYSSLMGLQSTQSSVNKFPTSFRLNIAAENTLMGLLSAMRQVAGNMGGGIEPTFKEGLPNLYCGVGTLLLGVLFLLSEDIRRRERLCCLLLLLFFNVSFVIRQLDYIWHGFHFTNMIPYRFSFLHSFVLLYMAYRAWLMRRRFDILQIIAAMLLTAALLCCSNDLLKTQTGDFGDFTIHFPVYFVINSLFLLAYGAAFVYGAWREKRSADIAPEELYQARKTEALRRLYARVVFLALVCVEMSVTLLCFGLYFPGTSVTNYPKGKEEMASMVRYMQEREQGREFYRAEVTHSQTLNDGALNGYNGISAFTSSANVHITEYLKALGYGAKNTYNRYCFEESSPVANLFLDLKYMLERDGRDRTSSMFSEVHHYGKVSLLRSNAWLPLGFLAEPELGYVSFSANVTPFQLQNMLFSAATGENADVWEPVGREYLNVIGEGVSVNDTKANGYTAYSDCVSGANLIYSYTVDRAGFACIHLDFPKRNTFYVSVNGEELYKEDISLPQMLAVKDVEPGDTVDIRIVCPQGESGNVTVTMAILDNDLFHRGYEKLAAQPLEIATFRDTFVEGTVECDRDGLLYTSIPQNGNWEAEVDGRKAEITLVGDCMISVPLTRGSHTVTFRYRNNAFSVGWKVSLICAVIFFLLADRFYRPDWRELYSRILRAQ